VVTEAVVAEEINTFFASVSAHLPPFDARSLDTLTSDYCDEYIIQPGEVQRQLFGIDVHKSLEHDGLPNWLLKEFTPVLSDPLAAIFNASLREGYFPSLWKSVEVVPVPKTNPPTSIHNDLRPIAILPVLAKIFESIVGRHLFVFQEPSLDDSQFGSRKGRSTTHAIVTLLHNWMASLDSGGSLQSVLSLLTSARRLTWLITIYYSVNLRNMTYMYRTSYLLVSAHTFQTVNRGSVLTSA